MRFRPGRAALLGALASLLLGGCNAILGIDDPRHRVPAPCGDGALDMGEDCDDGNARSGDGCDDACVIERGYTCTGEPSVCGTCGDGVIAAGEACDDGAAQDGDGCSASCVVEHGYTCTGVPSACATSCGDGLVAGAEHCDDANTSAGDGCDPSCLVEAGFQCQGEPSACVATCGDGLLEGDEGCDDANVNAGDGCDPSCKIEHGYGCNGQPSLCKTLCGDGLLAATEACDDGNSAGGDGCDPSCLVEHGYSCSGEPSACDVHCGDGKLGPTEQCDDSNAQSGDGCSPSCTIEPGFSCGGQEPSACSAICGDELVVKGEGCDDGDTQGGDGCSPACAVEPGYACAGAPSLCMPVCGDGVRLGSEGCDDGNTQGGDCCSALCQIEAGCEVEPDNNTAQADQNAALPQPVRLSGDGTIRGAIGAIGDLDYFSFDLLPALSVLRIETFDGSGSDCTGGVDTKVSLLNSVGIPMFSDADRGIGLCSAITISLPSGSYYVKVEGAGNAVIPAYVVEVDVQPSAALETESNDTPATADVLSGADGFVAGSHQSAGDVDYYKLTIPAGGSRSLRAEIIEGNAAESCESLGIESRLSLFKANAMLLAAKEGGGRGACSLLDGTGGQPADPGAHDLAPGVYYLAVQAAGGAVGGAALFDYKLSFIAR